MKNNKEVVFDLAKHEPEVTKHIFAFLSLDLTEDGQIICNDHEVARVNGMKVEIFSNEHPPPHFRVKRGSESNCYNICTGEPMYEGLKRYRRHIKRWHKANKQVLINAWNRLRPDDCSVGIVEC